MNLTEGIIFAVIGCILYQSVKAYQFRGNEKGWPWQDKQSAATVPYFVFGMVVKLFAAVGLTAILVVTDQISGPWAAFVTGMVADYVIAKIGDMSLREITQ